MNTGDPPYDLDIAVSGTSIYVVWQQRVWAGGLDPYYTDDIFIKRSTDAGATWKPTVRLTNNYDNNYDPAVAVSGSYVYVAWQLDTQGGDICLRRSANNGAGWNLTRLTNNAGSSIYPDAAFGTTHVYVVWVDNTPG